MMADMEKAQAAAIKPGDEKLSCDQLESELVAVTQDPEFQGFVQATGDEAEKRQAEMKLPKSQVAALTLRSALMATMPGAAFPGMAAAQADAMAKGAKSMSDMQSRMQRTQKLAALMPKLMRGQRVIELAAGKSCEWAAAAMGQ
jgi:hypothetical protein